jgi:S1-C subfamily serine protease
MNDANDRFVWTCAACGRKVPHRIDVCRCGTRREDGTTESTGGRSHALLVAIAILCGAALLLIVWMSGPGRLEPVAAPVASPAAAPTVDRAPVEAPAPTPLPTASPTPAQPVAPAVESTSASPAATPLEDMISRVIPAVVSIEAGQSRGTGFYIRPATVLTNAHVVEGQSSVELVAGTTRRTARVTSVSTASDLAVLQVFTADPGQVTLPLGSVGGVRVGQEVIAVGSALGVLSNTVTRGIVSAVRRAGAVTLIQTDAAINPGNSGGPLVDRAGLVIGINSLKIGRAAESLGFAVAADHASALLGGGPPPATTPAVPPSQGLDAMLRRGPSSDGERMRAQGEQQFARVVEAAARAADQLDAYWERSARTCVASSANAGDRRWFAVYETQGIRLNAQVYGCDAWLANLTANATRIRDEMTQGTESARRSGVYPGVMRDLRRRHRMEWAGWAN